MEGFTASLQLCDPHHLAINRGARASRAVLYFIGTCSRQIGTTISKCKHTWRPTSGIHSYRHALPILHHIEK